MGRDIHMYIEYRHNGCDWQADKHHVVRSEDGDCPRDVDAACRKYALFAELANVRGYGNRDIDPLGIPKDASKTVKKAVEYWRDDGHSHSWISLEDFEKIFKTKGWYDDSVTTTKAFFDWQTSPGSYGGYQDIINYCRRSYGGY